MTSFVSDFITNLPTLLEGLGISLLLVASTLAIGLPAALLLTLGVESRLRAVRWVCIFFIEFGRGAPALVLLQLAYYGLPGVGITLTSLVASTFALAWTAAGHCTSISVEG